MTHDVFRRTARAASVTVALLIAAPGCSQPRQPEPAAPLPPLYGGPVPTAGACAVTQAATTLPGSLDESSGVAESRRTPGVFWTHNDSGGEPEIHAVGLDGREVGRVRLPGADNRDWEDLAVGPCPSGSCVYAADVGDNNGVHGEIVLYRAPEPAPGDARTAPAERFTARYPDARHDAEGIFVLPDGSLYVVSKGTRELPIALYRWPTPLAAGQTATLERVRPLAEPTRDFRPHVTGAAASPDGRWVAVRSYQALALFRTPELLAGGPPALALDLRPLAEPQGEAVWLGDDGTVVLTTEARNGRPAALTRLKCPLP